MGDSKTSASTSNYNSVIDASSSLVKAGSAFASGVTQSAAYKMQGDYQKQTAEMNAQLAEFQAEDALSRGDKAANIRRARGKQSIGSLRASQAAQGIDVSSGSALDLQADTAQASEMDAITINNNAWRKAWGYKTEALTSRTAGNFASNYSNFNANQTLLTGGLSAASELLAGGYKVSRSDLFGKGK